MKKPIYKKWWFWAIVIVVLCCIASAAGLGGSTDNNSPDAKATSENAESAKEAAKDFDFTMWDQCTSRADANYDLLLDADSSANLAEMYSTFEGVQEQCWDIGDILDDTDIDVDAKDEAEAYLESVQGYVSSISVAADDFMKYINDGDMDALTSASESISAAEYARGEIVSTREAFLKASGFDESEISELL